MFILDVWTDTIVPGLYKVCLSIDNVIYSFINTIYQIFLILANAVLADSETLNGLIDRIYQIISVVMLFIIAYSLLRALVNPDELNKGEQSALKFIFNIVLSIVLIIIMPVIFEFAYKLQSALLTNNTIGNIIIGTDGDSADDISSAGKNMSFAIFQAFFHPSEAGNYCLSLEQEVNKDEYNCTILESKDNSEITYGFVTYEAKEAGNFIGFKNFVENIVDTTVNYNFLLSSVAGIFVIYILIVYCFDLGLRSVKLFFYQLISPVAVLSRLMPGSKSNDIFDKWVKATLATFMEVFIRIAILFFAVLMIQVVIDKFETAGGITAMFGVMSDDATNIGLFWPKAFIIMGILTFVKQAPKLISDLTGIDSGNMSLGIKNRLSGMLGAGVVGGIAGRVAGGATGFVGAGLAAKRAGGSFFAGGANGFVNGWKAKGNQFGKQKQAMYKRLGGKGRAGILGKRSWVDAGVSKAEGAYKKSVEKGSEKRAAAFEGSSTFKNAMSEAMNKERESVDKANSERFGLSTTDMRNAEIFGMEYLDSRIAAIDPSASKKAMEFEEKKLKGIEESAEFRRVTNRFALDMFKNSEYYDSTKSMAERKADFEKFKSIEANRTKILDYYVNNGGNSANFVQETRKKRDAAMTEYYSLMSQKRDLSKQRDYLEGRTIVDEDKVRDQVRAEFAGAEKPKGKAKRYQEDLSRASSMKKQEDQAKADADLRKLLDKLYKDADKKKDKKE